MDANDSKWEHYLESVGYDVVVVQYRGRGHEHFHDEVIQIFDWMTLHRRDFYLRDADRKFECDAMRPWDNFFWWLELEEYPENSIILPGNWPGRGQTRAARSVGTKQASNSLRITTAAKKATVWLNPELVDFDEPLSISFKRLRYVEDISGDVPTLLEDVRTRGDRQHPFWVKLELDKLKRR